MAEDHLIRLSLDTLAITGGRRHGQAGTSLNPPLEMASNFRHGSEDIYSRHSGTATWQAFEEALGILEGGRAVAFASGMGAIRAILDSMKVGARILAPIDAYAGAVHSLQEGLKGGRWRVEFIDTTATQSVLEALPGADLLWLESPSNPLLEISDLPRLCAAARDLGIPSVVDNTFATPVLQQPLDLGAEMSLHSCTKFIGGHSDLLLGAVVTRSQERFSSLRERRTFGGATPGGLESFLALRGLRTLPLRVRRAQATAGGLARRLEQHPRVARVRYPGLTDGSGELSTGSFMAQGGAMVSFELTGDSAGTDSFCNALAIIEHATSLGGVETSLERRSRYDGQEHLPPTLVRMSVGCEDPEDLWRDLEQALANQG